MTANDTSIDARDWSLLGLLSVLWGGSFFFNGVVLKELPPLTVVFLRVALAAIMLLPLLWLYRIRFPKGLSGWRPFFRDRAFQQRAAVLADRGRADLYPERAGLDPERHDAAVHGGRDGGGGRGKAVMRGGSRASSSGLIGVVILHGDGLGLESGQGLGILLCLAAAFSYGIVGAAGATAAVEFAAAGTATFQMLASAAMMTVVAGIVERPWQLPMPGATTWLAVIGLAALSTALAYIVFFQILRRSGATNVMLVTLLIPVTAILLGYLVLGEQISPREIAGALVIGSALLLIDGRVLKFFQR